MASVLLKRGRMILKKRYDSRKHALRNSLFKATSGWDSHKARLENINTANQNELSLSNNNLAITAGAPALKEAIKLEDKLISGEEIEFCPAYRIDSQHTECVTDEAVLGECLANESSRQSKISKNESSKFYLNNFESDNLSDKCPIIVDDYPKLYVSITDTSDKNAMAKSSLLKNIRSIQNTNEDSYGINISNSRFFVPKDYIFSGVESAMNDLKFEVDPEMGKLLQRSYSSPQVSTSLPILVNIEASSSSLDNTTVTAETLSVLNHSTKQRADPDPFRNIKALSDSICLTLKESDKAEQRQKLFLKRRESKPSCEIIDFILDKTTSKSKTIAESQIRNHVESLDELDNRRSIHENEKKSQETRYQNDHEFSSLKASCLKDETTEEETPYNNKELWIAKHMIDETMKPLCLDAVPGDRKVFDTLEESKISNSSDENGEVRSQRLTKSINTECEKIKSSRDILSAPLMRRKSYPLLTPSEIAYRSKYHLSIPVVSNTSGILGSHSEISESISESSINQEKQIGSLVYNEQLQEPKCPSSNEINRINCMRFPQGIHDYQIEKATSSESKLPTTSEEPKVSQNNMDLGSKQPSLMGRTSSLREKFETIVEDVELRTLSGRHPRISESCGRKSLS